MNSNISFAFIFDHHGEIRVRFGATADYGNLGNTDITSKNLIKVIEAEAIEIYRKIYEYAVENGIYIPQLELSDKDRILMLESAVKKLKWSLLRESHTLRLQTQEHQDKVFELQSINELQVNEIITHELTIELMQERFCSFEEALVIAEERTRIKFH